MTEEELMPQPEEVTPVLQDQPQDQPQWTFFRTLINTVLNKISLTDTEISKFDSWPDSEVIDQDGVLVAEIVEQEQPHVGLPDWIFTASVTGMTLTTTDGNKEIIRKMFAETLNSVCQLRKSDFPSGCCGILQVDHAQPRSDGEKNVFSIQFKLVFTDLNF